jgi:hypothetical protein
MATSWRPGIEVVRERVEDLRAHAVGGIRVWHGDLRETEERLVAALGDELGVDREAPVLRGALGEMGGHVRRGYPVWVFDPPPLGAHA